MSQNVRRRIWQAALTLGALLITILAPLSGTASYAAAPNTGDTNAAVKVIAPGSAERAITAMVPNAVAAIGGIPAVAPSTQFDITGFLQSATLDNPNDAHSGGTALVNGHTVVIPRETIVILPASALTWQELFTKAPAGYAPTQTGLALNDNPKPLTTYEVHIVGNRVISAGSDRYIAGLVNISQQDLNSGAGYINFIDYTNGRLEVGGTPGVAGTGTVLTINDPAIVDTNNDGVPDTGRYGRANTTDDLRFQVDQDNPTILAETGFPMCLPRVAPPAPGGAETDPLCPQANRPNISNPVVDTSGITPQPNALVAGQPYTVFRMDSPTNVDNTPALCLRQPCADPRKQAPFEIGDYVTFAGTLTTDPTTPTGTHIAAHTIVASLGIYTQTGIDPAYVTVDVSLIGTGGLTVFGAGEAAVRTRFEGMSTDESRLVRVYGVDINPVTGATSDRDWGSVMPDPGPPAGAVRGRWRLRPPCTATAGTVSDKKCTPPPAGGYVPPTREVRAVIDGLQQFNLGTIIDNPASQIPGTPSAKTAANGIFYGQYHAPIEEYIFPENVPGTAVPENNFNTIPFLAYGGYQSITGVQAGVLNPWPSNVVPPALVCATPTLNGAPYSVANGATIQLSGSLPAGVTTPVTFSWVAGTGVLGSANESDLNGALTNVNTLTPSFNATGIAAGVYNINLIASNACGVVSVSNTITVTPAPAPTISPIQNQTVTAGAIVTINASSTSLPAPTWTWTNTAQPVGAPIPGFVQTPSAATASATSSIVFTTDSANPGTYSFSVTATNANGTSSPVIVTITTTTNVPTNITFGGTLEYRIAKQRLVMTATSTDATISGMTLMPYLTEAGTIFDPATLGNQLTISLVTPGSFTITLVGAPKPACNLGGTYATPCAQKPITVKAWKTTPTNIVGTSAPSALDRIRQ